MEESLVTELVAKETAIPVFGDLKRLLPVVAEELNCSPEDLVVYDYLRLPGEYMHSDYRDIPYRFVGSFAGAAFIHHRRKHGSGPMGYGCAFYRSRESADLRYALFVVPGQWGDSTYIILKSTDVFKYRRVCDRLTRLANPADKPPVLADGLLESISDSTIGFLRNSKKIEKYGVKIKRGILLGGPPGNGKTMICRHIQKLCSQRSYTWGVVTSAEIDRAYHDKELNDLFRMYTVTFFDDIDVGYMDRSKGNGKMACSLLTAMDGMYDSGHLVRIFTTNEELKELDPAFLRPGRIDQCYTLQPPDVTLRRQLVTTVWPQEIQDNIDVEYLITNSEDFSFAELEAIRTFLVTNKILGDGTWDLERAFEEYHLRREETKPQKKMKGFAGNNGSSKSKPTEAAQSRTPKPTKPCGFGCR